MPKGERLCRFLASVMLHQCHGIAIILFEGGKVTHVETETRRTWQYKDLPEETNQEHGAVIHSRL